MPVLVCGPGSIEQAHKPNEFIEVTQIESCISMMRALLAHLRMEHEAVNLEAF
jgi:acetylornithine deacetylase